MRRLLTSSALFRCCCSRLERLSLDLLAGPFIKTGLFIGQTPLSPASLSGQMPGLLRPQQVATGSITSREGTAPPSHCADGAFFLRLARRCVKEHL